jgi:hypothetical protein
VSAERYKTWGAMVATSCGGFIGFAIAVRQLDLIVANYAKEIYFICLKVGDYYKS